MSAKIVKTDSLNPDAAILKEAAEILAGGGLVIMPTETVYGVGASILNEKALDRLFAIKNRPKDKPFSLHIDKKEMVEDVAQDIPISAYKLMDRFWPGPLTLVLKSKNQGNVGLRMPDDKIALGVIALLQAPVALPSANISGKPAPINFPEALQNLEEQVDLAIDAGPTRLQIESSVVDLTVEPLKLLREGALKKEEIEKTCQKKNVLFVCTGNSCRSVMAKGLLEKKIKEAGRQDIEVFSAGIMMLGGLGATEETKELLSKEGIDVSGHLSQKVTAEVLKKSDIILVMERLQEEKVLQLAPQVKNRVFLLKEFAKIDDNNLDVADPIGKSREFYAQTFGLIKEAVERIIKLI